MSSVQAVRSRLMALFALFCLWLGLGFGLSLITRRVADWFVMTDELLYERLAISVARTHSLLPRVHTEVISNLNQLYPLVIAPTFRQGSVLHGFHEAHILNAFVMTSTVFPVYVLARRVTHNRWLPFVVAVASVCVPWLTLSSFLLSEVVAYPVFALALLALQAAVARPSARNDVLAAGAIALAVLARTEFYALAVALAAAIVLRGLVEGRLGATLRAHVTLAVFYVLGGIAALGALVTGHHVLGTYTQTATGNPLPPHILDSAPAHVAIVALAGGLLPFLIGGAWITSNLRRSENAERHAFAWVAVAVIVTLAVEVASFDLRFGGGLVRDRYLFYLTPVILVAFAAGLTASRLPRWSLATPIAVLVIGFWRAPLPTFQKLNADTPASVINDWLLREQHGVTGTRFFLVLAAALLAGAFVEATVLLPRVVVAIGASVLLLVALTAETGYAFKRLFAINGTSGLPMTLDQSGVMGWVDREITTTSEAVMVPYPVIRGDYWANAGFWWDLEFWNKSVDREAAHPSQFSVTPPGSFPKIDPRFDPRTGLANFDLDSYVAQATTDARFHIEGRVLSSQRGVSVVFPDRPWRADWVSYGLYPDGWTRPGRAARFRVFPQREQMRPRLRTLHVTLLVPAEPRAVRLVSNVAASKGKFTGTQQMTLSVCVPADRPGEVKLTAIGSSPVEGDPSTSSLADEPRSAGVLVSDVALDPPSPGASCSPRRGTR